MTNQSKTYIEPGDIAGIRFQCRKCGSAVSLPISAEINFSRVGNCPNCSEPWTATMQTTVQPALKKCADAIWELTEVLKNFQNVLAAAGFKGFALSLELSEDVGRASSGKD